jgi:hypothetical protein
MTIEVNDLTVVREYIQEVADEVAEEYQTGPFFVCTPKIQGDATHYDIQHIGPSTVYGSSLRGHILTCFSPPITTEDDWHLVGDVNIADPDSRSKLKDLLARALARR